MVKVPTEVIDGLKDLAEVSEIPFDTVKKEFMEILELPAIATSDAFTSDEEKANAGFNIIRARYFDRIEQQGAPYEGTIVEIIPTKSVQSKKKDEQTGQEVTREFKVANLFAVMVPLNKDNAGNPLDEIEPSYAAISLYDDGCSIVDDGSIKKGKSYRMHLMGGSNPKGYFELSSNVRPKVTEIDLKLPPLKNILPEIFQTVTLASAPLNTSKNRSDVKLLRATVRSSRVVARKDNKGYLGFYNVIDHSIDTRAFKQNPKSHDFTIRCDPSWLKYDTGSDILFLGTIDNDPNYGAGMWADVVLPVLPIPKVVSYAESAEINKKPAGGAGDEPPKDAVDMSELLE